MNVITKLDGYRWVMRAPKEPLIREEFTALEPGEDEAVVRVVGCGVCHTDLGFLYDGVRTRHALPLALGHEISGEVIATGSSYEHLLGRAVVVPAVTPCGRCDACLEGFGTVCRTQVMPGNDVQGGFASHLIVPARGLCIVEAPGALEGGELAKSGCTLAELSVVADAVSTPYQAICRSGLGDGDLAIVIGLGGVGGFAVQIAKALGAHVVGFDVAQERIDALAKYGLELGINPKGLDGNALAARVKEFASSKGIAPRGWKIFECSGSHAGQELAWRLLGPAAYLSVVGFTMDKLEVRLSNLMAYDAVAAGNWGCLPELYPALVSMVLEGRISVRPFVEVHPMADAQSVLERAHAHLTRQRPVLVP